MYRPLNEKPPPQISPTSSRKKTLRTSLYNNNHHHYYSIPIKCKNQDEEDEVNDCKKNCQFLRFRYSRAQLRYCKILIGLAIIVISLLILAYNERCAAEISKSYDEGLGSIRILSNNLQILPENDGKLVYMNGYLTIAEPLQEFPYGVSIYAVKLKRRVQMYQWVEENVIVPIGQSPYRYEKQWRDKLVNSDEFGLQKGHENPKKLAIQSEIRINLDVKLGSYILGPELKDKFTNYIQFTSGERPSNQKIKMHMGLYYHCSNIWSPTVGDTRLQFSFAGAADTHISVIAMQSGEELKPFITQSGTEILYLYEGRVNHLEIFKSEHSSFVFRSWYIRILVWMLLVLGSFLSTKAITYFRRRNFIVKNLMAVGPFKLCTILATCLSLIITGCAWFKFRPVFGCLIATFSCCLLLYYALVPEHNESDNTNGIMKTSCNMRCSALSPPYRKHNLNKNN